MTHRDLTEIHKEIETNNPPIKINQYWSNPIHGVVLRRLRILAPHPDGGWIVQEMPSKFYKGVGGDLTRCPEFNLRFVFRPENE